MDQFPTGGVDHFQSGGSKAYAEQVKGDAEQVMDLIYSLDDWRSWQEVQGLKGKKILDAHGFHVGDVEVWTLDTLVQYCPDSPWEEDDEDEAA